jgi:hypothetical protein
MIFTDECRRASRPTWEGNEKGGVLGRRPVPGEFTYLELHIVSRRRCGEEKPVLGKEGTVGGHAPGADQAELEPEVGGSHLEDRAHVVGVIGTAAVSENEGCSWKPLGQQQHLGGCAHRVGPGVQIDRQAPLAGALEEKVDHLLDRPRRKNQDAGVAKECAIKLFFNYSIDCETPAHTDYTGPERRPFFHGPEDWAFAEVSTRGFVERMTGLGVRDGTTLFVYPDVARHQSGLYREMADAGIEVALHLNGLRYSRLRGDRARWLGEMSLEEQREAIRMGKEDLEQVTGRACLGYRACYGSANDDTFPILHELGFTWASNACARRRPEFFADWAESCREAHFADRENKGTPGDLDVYEVPVTCGRTICYGGDPDQPLDLRVETPPVRIGEEREQLRAVIEENLEAMEGRAAPVRAVIGASHNTNPFGDRTTHQSATLDWVVRHAREAAAARGLAWEPAPFARMWEEGLGMRAG